MRGRALTVALAVSLAGNLFLGGLIAGAKLRGGREAARESPTRTARMAAVYERLDPAEAEALRGLLRERSEAAEPRLAALRNARRELNVVMAQPSYDPVAARAALSRIRADEAAIRGDVDEALLRFAVRLDADERAAIAPLLRKHRRLSEPSSARPER